MTNRHQLTDANEEELQTQIECVLLDKQQKILFAKPEAAMCLFRPDGTVVASDHYRLTKYDRAGEVLWEQPFASHHMLRESSDGTILILTSEVKTWGGQTHRFDRVEKVSQSTGAILYSFSLAKNFDQLVSLAGLKTQPQPESAFWQIDQQSQTEMTHANSAYEIPENALAEKNPAFAAGNVIVNVNTMGLFFILDSKLKKPLWAAAYLPPNKHRLHDVQVLKNGHLLVFNNYSNASPPYVSSLDEYDVETGKVVWRFQPENPKTLASLWVGSVQALKNGNIFYSDMTSGGFAVEIDRAGREISRQKHWALDRKGQPRPFQEAKRANFAEFLSRAKQNP